MIDREEFAGWLRLLETPGVGRETARRLLETFGSPEAVFGASSPARRAIVSPAIAAALDATGADFEALLTSSWQWLTEAANEERDVLVLGDSRYPEALLHSSDPPLMLYVRGRIDLLSSPSIAVVGSRNPTPQGAENARAFAAHLGRAGFTIVSGLALGIDGAAHEGALDAGAGTVAVVGTGIDRVYPARHRGLARRIAAEGVVVSEFAVGTPSMASNFPVRNRIIAGLSRGTLVVEAAIQSGSIITARLATENGRDVFAIPGSIHSPQSRGCHALIKQGAKLVDAAADILQELGPLSAATPAAGSTLRSADAPPEAAADPLLTAIGFEPIGLDELIARTGRSAADLSARLLDLELAGRLARLPGQRFQRLERG